MKLLKKSLLIALAGTGMLAHGPVMGMGMVQSAGVKSLNVIKTFHDYVHSGDFGEQFLKHRVVNIVKKTVPGLSLTLRLGSYANVLRAEWNRPVFVPAPQGVPRPPHLASKNPQAPKAMIASDNSWHKKVRGIKTLARLVMCDEVSGAISSPVLNRAQRGIDKIFGMRLNHDHYKNASFIKKFAHFTALETMDEIIGFNASIIAAMGYSIASRLISRCFS